MRGTGPVEDVLWDAISNAPAVCFQARCCVSEGFGAAGSESCERWKAPAKEGAVSLLHGVVFVVTVTPSLTAVLAVAKRNAIRVGRKSTGVAGGALFLIEYQIQLHFAIAYCKTDSYNCVA